MLPANLAESIRQQVLYYLQSTFDFRDPAVDDAFRAFLLDPDAGLFKGPWLMLRRPFRPAPAGVPLPFDINVTVHPFLHQYKAWLRLSSKGKAPEPTIITTGTGSGKTECFLYPILDHCLRERRAGRKGIKAIILYPMNALATDQEKRFARTVWENTALRGAGIRVGQYTGRYDPSDPGASRDSGTTAMSRDHGITNHQAQLEDPPDVLLTNYKMLDFLLMRPGDKGLWKDNEPGTLRYLVLDELHTYDGAQGADVACLIRRLKERLGAKRGELCVIGTSATLDDRSPRANAEGIEDDTDSDRRETGEDRLARFASKLFEEDVPVEAVIGEDRLSVDEIVRPATQDVAIPQPQDCAPRPDEESLVYSLRMAGLWGAPPCRDPRNTDAVDQWQLEVADWLKQTSLFRDLLHVFQKAEQMREDPLLWREAVARLALLEPGLAAIGDDEGRAGVVASFLALVAIARVERSGRAWPLVPSQVQIWVRELRRLGRLVQEKPAFAWLDEPLQGLKNLPTFHCSECGESGWVAHRKPSEDTLVESKGVRGFLLEDDPQKIYREWFGMAGKRGPHIVLVCPGTEKSAPATSEGEQSTLPFLDEYLCLESLVVREGDGPCPLTGSVDRLRVRTNQDTSRTERGELIGVQKCPCCGSREGIFFVGSQAATLASVALDELFGSVLNEQPKLLAFTDSVQDASHRAGFFTARTYNFTFRTAMQHIVDEAGPQGVPLSETGKRLLEWCAEKASGRPGSLRDAMAVLLPPDLAEYGKFLEYAQQENPGDPPQELREEIEKRLTWQATSEFGLMQTHGRTLESNGVCALGWSDEFVASTVRGLRDRLPKVSPQLAGLGEKALRLWLLGVLYRYRVRGAIDHPYLEYLAKCNHWGKFAGSRKLSIRETYPAKGRYSPRLMVTQSVRDHEHVLAATRSKQMPWHVKWARRALELPGTDETTLLDLIRQLLDVGTDTGLFRLLHVDGAKQFYAISAEATRVYADPERLECSQSAMGLARPAGEAALWHGAPSMEYYADQGRYRPGAYTERQKYYQARYRKGALRRVVANEHTGLLATKEREDIEHRFSEGKWAEDPNVLTCTSTLEMGIDIGDLSSTMLCSIPPNTASYLQRIGRAGRLTGTALIVSVVNQRPHDLFFYARPAEMLKGKVDPPGCWLDAPAVLARQYLGFCFDCATHEGIVEELPASANRFVEDMDAPDGTIPRMMEWVGKNEAVLQQRFLSRFSDKDHVRDDTRQRLARETSADLLLNLMHQVAQEHDRARRELVNARKRLQDQLKSLEQDDRDSAREIRMELRVLEGRVSSLNKVSTLELLTDHGLLPNYAFPERGVRFSGAVHNTLRYQDTSAKVIELTRPAGVAIKELAPANTFYTHSRQFQIQQIAIGNPQQTLAEVWAICGNCGHMRLKDELNKPEAVPACPQCGHEGDHHSQLDVGQQRQFMEYSKSQAVSYMDTYDSQSGDRSEERQRQLYQILRSFDQTIEAPVGAVGDDDLPFGIEYRAAMIMRDINVGYYGQGGTVMFGPDQKASDSGFEVCLNCGVVVPPGKGREDAEHRRSCSGRRAYEKMRQEGKSGNPFKWEKVYLYRQLRSEAIRLLLPLVDDENLDTLIACVYLGLRLRFEGNPAHLIVAPQRVPDQLSEVTKHYLVMMDAVPGGTGYLKSLYQERDEQGRDGEGIMDVLRRALDTLETCQCRKLHTGPDPDGCYRCIRTYHMQYQAERISRDRGIEVLKKLIEAGERRLPKKELASIKPDSLFGSVLEKRFVGELRSFVEGLGGKWDTTIFRGSRGFVFTLPKSPGSWELELQPSLGPQHGVMVQCQPDFLLRCSDHGVKPVAIFTDGFEFHCHPNNRLADDCNKRRAILASGNYLVWSVTWEDLKPENAGEVMVCHPQLSVFLDTAVGKMRQAGHRVPTSRAVVGNGLEQLKSYLLCPNSAGWAQLGHFLAFFPLQRLCDRGARHQDIESALEMWRTGSRLADIVPHAQGDWVCTDKIATTMDVVAHISVGDALTSRSDKAVVLMRLGDSAAEVCGDGFLDRWRRYLACLNLYQFCKTISFWAASEVGSGTAPELTMTAEEELSPDWEDVLETVVQAVRPFVKEMAGRGVAAPRCEFYNTQVDEDAFAELAWVGTRPVAVLAGEQADFAEKWRSAGWVVFTADDLQANGVGALVDAVAANRRND